MIFSIAHFHSCCRTSRNFRKLVKLNGANCARIERRAEQSFLIYFQSMPICQVVSRCLSCRHFFFIWMNFQFGFSSASDASSKQYFFVVVVAWLAQLRLWHIHFCVYALKCRVPTRAKYMHIYLKYFLSTSFDGDKQRATDHESKNKFQREMRDASQFRIIYTSFCCFGGVNRCCEKANTQLNIKTAKSI